MAEYWSMEVPAAEWMPGDLQRANWTPEPAAACALRFPTIEYGSTEIFDSSCYQTSITIPDGEQLCGYEVATQTDPHQAAWHGPVIDLPNMQTEHPHFVMRELTSVCENEAEGANLRMHRYPPSILALCLNGRLTTPKVVAIGPYYHKFERLQQAQKLKYVAVYSCVRGTTRGDLKPVYEEFAPVADDARIHYDQAVVGGKHGIGYHDFRDMMFADACFLVQYMFLSADYPYYSKEMSPSLVDFFDTNEDDIFHDIMLLENQIPWLVVQKIIDFMKLDAVRKCELLTKFIYYHKGCLRDLKLKDDSEEKHFKLYHCGDYKPPHLLGLLWYYIVGRDNTKKTKPPEVDDTISFSVGAIQLAEIGVNLKANDERCTDLTHMGVEISCIVGCSELFLAPVTLDDARASFLISMAAHELCTIPNFRGVDDKYSAVCSYLLLLAMLVAREQDVQKLREEHILLGGGYADKEVLDFVTKLHDLRLGTCYVRVMKQIADYQRERRTCITPYSFVYKYWKYISAVFSIIAGSGIVSKLLDKYF